MIRGAIIGFGKIAQTAHMPAYQAESLRSRVTICAAAEPNERVRSEAQVKFPGLRFYASVEELFDHELLHFVDICTPPNLHSSMIRMAIERRLHMICEKPFATDVREAECLAEELMEYPELAFAPCHQYRHSPLWMGLETFVRERRPREHVLIQASVYRTTSDPGIAADGNGWRRNWAVSGGGIVSDIGVHYMALAEWMLGMPEEISCRTYHLNNTGTWGEEVEDTAIVELKHTDGIFQFTLTWAADRRANSLQAVSPLRSFVYDGGLKAFEYRDGSCSRMIVVTDPSDKSQYIGYFEKIFLEFLAMTVRNDQHRAAVEAALHSSVMLDAAYRAARSGASVRLGKLA